MSTDVSDRAIRNRWDADQQIVENVNNAIPKLKAMGFTSVVDLRGPDEGRHRRKRPSRAPASRNPPSSFEITMRLTRRLWQALVHAEGTSP